MLYKVLARYNEDLEVVDNQVHCANRIIGYLNFLTYVISDVTQLNREERTLLMEFLQELLPEVGILNIY